MAREAIFGDVQDYSFPLLGGGLLVAPVDTAIPSPVLPIDDFDNVSSYLYLGPSVNGEVNVTLSISTEDINTGVIPQLRRKYITGQSGRVESRLWFYEPQRVARASGLADADVLATAAVSGTSRAFKDAYYGGKLGDKQALLIVHDFDINLVEDDPSGDEYQQQWLYSPRTQKDGDIVLTDRETRSPVTPFNFALIAYSAAAVTDRNVLIQQRWIEVA